ncbi:hypothetical protein THO17_33950 [Marinomonas sp. THO17]
MQVSFYAFFANKNDQPDVLMSVARWWIETHQLNHFEKATKIYAMVASMSEDSSLAQAKVLNKGINHLTLQVSNLTRSLAFYIDQLGFCGEVRWASGAYLSYGDAWLCLSLGEPNIDANDYTHYAFDVSEQTLQALQKRQAEFNVWQANQSEGGSIYIADPDGHKLEFHIGSLSSRLASLKQEPYKGLIWL